MPTLSRITLFPIKALDGISVTEASITGGGSLTHDRQYALFDPDGKFVNGKRYEKIHSLRSRFDLATGFVTLYPQGATQEQHHFHVEQEIPMLERWLSDFLGFSVAFKHDTRNGFPDDPEAYGPTLISTATLEEVYSWYPELSLDNTRRRFRANLELTGIPAFWEDRLFAEPDTVIDFSVGSVRFEGTNPCQRCIVPSRDPDTGTPYPEFHRVFVTQRQAKLPEWSVRSRFNHFYRLSVNTRIPLSEAGKVLRLGDEVEIHGVRQLRGGY